MNSCILMAEVVQDPELRYTPDNQTPLAELWVQFPGLRDEDPPEKLKVVGWGNLAQEIQERYHVGDRVIIEGRLHMNTIERPEGFKEKRAELTAQKIHLLGADASITSTSASLPTAAPTAAAPASPVATAAPSAPKAKPASRTPKAEPAATKSPAYSAPAPEPIDYDEIPF
ncbi:MAG: single-stranded DNA-binding protein [Leptolyngbya sp. IPPAS B-1204]|nr:single-stranded DNA-binding protein [Elainella sp. C42_A2020_010]RNJ67463.1 MAG: single-stranded DNA-binding protein [Leptolyngbya sp. IPPAS B-1204]